MSSRVVKSIGVNETLKSRLVKGRGGYNRSQRGEKGLKNGVDISFSQVSRVRYNWCSHVSNYLSLFHFDTKKIMYKCYIRCGEVICRLYLNVYNKYFFILLILFTQN